MALYRAARHACPAVAGAAGARTAMSGHYNQNVRVDTPDGPVLVRIPLPCADQMDLRIWAEPDVLRAVAPHVDRVPWLLYSCADPPFQIHEFITGIQLNQLAPRGTAVPDSVIPHVLALFDRLSALSIDELPVLPAGWPDDGKCADFAHTLSAMTQRVYDGNREEFGELFGALGIPDDPLGTVTAAWPRLSSRPFRVLHTDVHRQNIVMSARGAVFLDWELALYGDPVYDLAVHLNKMTYLTGEIHTLLTGWEAGAERRTARSWRADLSLYLRHEQVKSAIVHTVRYSREIAAADPIDGKRAVLTEKLTRNLNAAGAVWGRPAGLSTRHVISSIAHWAARTD